jgi:hypothetical protein
MMKMRLSSFSRACKADGAGGFRLVHLAVAAEHPDLAIAGVGNAAGVQVLEKPGLVDRHQWSEAHRNRRELPEIRHQLRVGIGREPLAVDFLPEVDHLLLGEAAFQEGPSIQPWRTVSLEVHQIAAVTFMRRMPEVVHAGADHGRE